MLPDESLQNKMNVNMECSKIFMFKGYKVYVVPNFEMIAGIGYVKKKAIKFIAKWIKNKFK